jgi:hypothetical protein
MKKNKGKQKGEVQAGVKRLTEMVNNLNAWAMEQVRVHQEREVLLQMLTTCVTLVVKDVLGRGLSEEETAALTEALDGPPKKGESNGSEATERAEGTAAQPAGGDVPGE